MEQDFKEAVHFYREIDFAEYPPYDPIAKDLQASARYDLAHCFMNGEGVMQSLPEAIRLMRLSAEAGLDAAQNDLGVWYETGRGVVKNLEEAYFWFLLAAANGSQVSLGNIDIVENELTPQKKREVQSRAEKWFEEHQ